MGGCSPLIRSAFLTAEAGWGREIARRRTLTANASIVNLRLVLLGQSHRQVEICDQRRPS
jgi:hypothetical protein